MFNMNQFKIKYSIRAVQNSQYIDNTFIPVRLELEERGLLTQASL